MSDDVGRLAAAEAAAAAARARLSSTLAELQQRLEPQRLARDARRGLADAGIHAAEQARDVARRRPGTLAGVMAAAGLFLARHRIVALVRREPEQPPPPTPVGRSTSGRHPGTRNDR